MLNVVGLTIPTICPETSGPTTVGIAVEIFLTDYIPKVTKNDPDRDDFPVATDYAFCYITLITEAVPNSYIGIF
jgi:hypothetical protein